MLTGCVMQALRRSACRYAAPCVVLTVNCSVMMRSPPPAPKTKHCALSPLSPPHSATLTALQTLCPSACTHTHINMCTHVQRIGVAPPLQSAAPQLLRVCCCVPLPLAQIEEPFSILALEKLCKKAERHISGMMLMDEPTYALVADQATRPAHQARTAGGLPPLPHMHCLTLHPTTLYITPGMTTAVTSLCC